MKNKNKNKILLISVLLIGVTGVCYADDAEPENALAIDFKKHPIRSFNNIVDMGFNDPSMPPRFGISFMYPKQWEKGNITELNVNFGGLPIKGVNTDTMKTTSEVFIARMDYFVLPFFQVHGFLGKFNASAKANLGDKLQIGNGNPFPVGDITISYKEKGTVWGVGGTLAGGYGDYWAAGDYTYSVAIPDSEAAPDTTVHASSLRVGTNYSFKNIEISPYVGAMYQSMDSQITNNFSTTGSNGKPLDIDFKINIEMDKVTPVAGANFSLPYDIGVLLEGSWGDRRQILAEISWRFDAPWDKRAAAKNAKKRATQVI